MPCTEEKQAEVSHDENTCLTPHHLDPQEPTPEI